MVLGDSGSDPKEGNDEHKVPNFESIKHFDVVDDFSIHHYNNMASPGEKESVKRIQEEWKILENGLPETIYVRVCEAKMGLLRAVIIGPAGTPYHDGLFVFDCFFPPKYPNVPPLVYYYSGGLRLNPNLYRCGRVCLSLLGTWHGKETELWVPGKSTMLQVLVSIQALILNAKPFFNEPGYDTSYVGDVGERRSRKYNEKVYTLSLKTMIYTLRRPPQHFKGFVASYFRCHAPDIIGACQAYKEGATVGTVVVKDGVPDPNIIEQGSSEEFKATMARMIDLLSTAFTENGSTECEQSVTSKNMLPL
ncbi:putative ubiquitin-conjugating enzyme E2 38 [Hibiscus syriacus]|uniref:putative ubiquitin-conjugating enzyme E2 38 n=1 Tax=Hibiscus syriacus TaxID=106335 RepID=UPI001921F6CA|nr:putative ubiquitin-conjugating enzyme E2 38 [Hibiscus syriacus]